MHRSNDSVNHSIIHSFVETWFKLVASRVAKSKRQRARKVEAIGGSSSQIVEQFSSGVAVGERSDGARGGIASSHVAPSTRSTLIILLGLPPGATSGSPPRRCGHEGEKRGREIPPCSPPRRIGEPLLHPSPSSMETAMWFSPSSLRSHSKFYGGNILYWGLIHLWYTRRECTNRRDTKGMYVGVLKILLLKNLIFRQTCYV